MRKLQALFNGIKLSVVYDYLWIYYYYYYYYYYHYYFLYSLESSTRTMVSSATFLQVHKDSHFVFHDSCSRYPSSLPTVRCPLSFTKDIEGCNIWMYIYLFTNFEGGKAQISNNFLSLPLIPDVCRNSSNSRHTVTKKYY